MRYREKPALVFTRQEDLPSLRPGCMALACLLHEEILAFGESLETVVERRNRLPEESGYMLPELGVVFPPDPDMGFDHEFRILMKRDFCQPERAMSLLGPGPVPGTWWIGDREQSDLWIVTPLEEDARFQDHRMRDFRRLIGQAG